MCGAPPPCGIAGAAARGAAGAGICERAFIGLAGEERREEDDDGEGGSEDEGGQDDRKSRKPEMAGAHTAFLSDGGGSGLNRRFA